MGLTYKVLCLKEHVKPSAILNVNSKSWSVTKRRIESPNEQDSNWKKVNGEKK